MLLLFLQALLAVHRVHQYTQALEWGINTSMVPPVWCHTHTHTQKYTGGVKRRLLKDNRWTLDLVVVFIFRLARIGGQTGYTFKHTIAVSVSVWLAHCNWGLEWFRLNWCLWGNTHVNAQLCLKMNTSPCSAGLQLNEMFYELNLLIWSNLTNLSEAC